MSHIISYGGVYVVALGILILISVHAYRLRKQLDEMHGMMAGMTLGMLAGLLTATLYVIPTGDFLWGVIGGSLIGLLFGVPLGGLGKHLGIVEGVIAGPMGGMMGAMLGQMIRPFDLEIFIPFFVAILLLTLAGIVYAFQCRVNCCPAEIVPVEKTKKNKEWKNSWVLASIALGILLLGGSIFLSFPLGEESGTTPASSEGEVVLPPALQQLNKEERGTAVITGNVQEIDLRITAAKYSPNVIVAKRGIPLQIHVRADENAGCAREIVFPDFGIDEIVSGGEEKTIEFLPEQAGTFPFRCSMDMVRGKLIIE